jgi:hypothetical protein
MGSPPYRDRRGGVEYGVGSADAASRTCLNAPCRNEESDRHTLCRCAGSGLPTSGNGLPTGGLRGAARRYRLRIHGKPGVRLFADSGSCERWRPAEPLTSMARIPPSGARQSVVRAMPDVAAPTVRSAPRRGAPMSSRTHYAVRDNDQDPTIHKGPDELTITPAPIYRGAAHMIEERLGAPHQPAHRPDCPWPFRPGRLRSGYPDRTDRLGVLHSGLVGQQRRQQQVGAGLPLAARQWLRLMRPRLACPSCR